MAKSRLGFSSSESIYLGDWINRKTKCSINCLLGEEAFLVSSPWVMVREPSWPPPSCPSTVGSGESRKNDFCIWQKFFLVVLDSTNTLKAKKNYFELFLIGGIAFEKSQCKG